MKPMKLLYMLVIAAAVASCSRNRPVVLDPFAGSCYCSIQYDVKQTVGNLVMGDMRFSVRNGGSNVCQAAVPKQDAQALTGDSAQGFSVDEQPAKAIAPGQTVTFLIPFAMTSDFLRAERLFALRVDDKIAVVGPAPEAGASHK